MKNITAIGVDIAKNVLQIHGSDSKGKAVLQKRISRDKFLMYMSNLPKCVVGLEACSGAHYWSGELSKLGFNVKLMSPRKVKKYAEHNKNDAKDAAACAEAVTRGSMTFVAAKTEVQLEIQGLHRVRSYYVKSKTSLSNMMRGILAEKGIIIGKGKASFERKIKDLLGENFLSGAMEKLMTQLYKDYKKLDEEIERYTRELDQLASEDVDCQKIMSISGIGSLTASALIAKIGNGNEFRKGRELSAYLGLVPKQHSSGEKQSLQGISKHGDSYIRRLLVHGGRSVLIAARKRNKISQEFEKQDPHSQWVRRLIDRVGMNKASVAVANKNARMIVAVLKNQNLFDPVLAHEYIG